MRRLLQIAVLGAMVAGLVLPSSAAALSQGTLSGVVTGKEGPVSGALIVAKGVTNQVNMRTAGDGSYSFAAWPDTYEIAVEPPAGSPDGFTTKPGFVVYEGATTTANITLSQVHGTTHVTGNASYSDHSPDAGVEVSIYEQHFASGLIKGNWVYTDEAGNWDAGELPSGIYSVYYSVNISNGSPSQRQNASLGGSLDFLRPGEIQNLSQTLSGPKPEGMIEATLTAAEGWPSLGSTSLIFPGEAPEAGFRIGGGPTHLFAPTGSYSVEAFGTREEDDAPTTVPVSVTNGHVTHLNIQLPPLPIPAGITAQNSQQETAWLNAQRAHWGLPASVANVPVWSDACAAHDNWGHLNNMLEHEENSTLPGASPGGDWAGTHAVLAEGDWGEEANPWYDAPYHLGQFFAPSMVAIGLDDSHGYQCATTWPGIFSGYIKEPFAAGTVYTFPGDGTTGLPPAEFASERPTTPNKVLGIPDLAGRSLLVYEAGAEFPSSGELNILSASLKSASGPVAVKWLNENPAGIIVPVEPLKPFTTYTATIVLAGFRTNRGIEVPQITHTWSFTTGHDNPNGDWSEPKPKPEKKRGPQRKISAKWSKGQIIVKGWNFKTGQVVIKRKVLLKSKRRFNGKVMARASVGSKGTFVARFRWPKRHISLRVYQEGKSTFGIYNPPHPPSWYRHHHKHGGK